MRLLRSGSHQVAIYTLPKPRQASYHEYPSRTLRFMRIVMISISDTAQAHFRKLLEKQPDGTNIRVFVVNPEPRMPSAAYPIAHPTRSIRKINTCPSAASTAWSIP